MIHNGDVRKYLVAFSEARFWYVRSIQVMNSMNQITARPDCRSESQCIDVSLIVITEVPSGMKSIAVTPASETQTTVARVEESQNGA